MGRVKPPPDGDRDGLTYDHGRDYERLNTQQRVVYDVMRDGAWYTPEQLEEFTGYGWASISARLRDLRKPQFGGHVVEREGMGGGLFRYRLVLRQPRRKILRRKRRG